MTRLLFFQFTFFIGSLFSQTFSGTNFQERLVLFNKLSGKSAIFELKSGGGLYFYNAREQLGTNYRDTSYAKPFYQFSLAASVKSRPDLPLYQGPMVSLLVVPAQTEPRFLPYSNQQNWNSDFGGAVIQGTYLLSLRWYDLSFARDTGWSYKMVHFGLGPSAFVHVLNGTNDLKSTAGGSPVIQTNGAFVSTKFGLTLTAGLDFSFRDSPLSFGILISVSDMFAPPKRGEILLPLEQANYVFISPLSYHQILASFQVGFTLQL